MKPVLHRVSAIIATLCIVTFFITTIVSELFFDMNAVAQVKSLIVMPGLFVLIAAIAFTGATGFSMARNTKKGIIGQKKKRMPFIAANGLLILLPSAIFLNHWASVGQFDNTFYIVQGIEITVGAANILLMTLNILDGRKLTQK